jgi:hypothetical protein
VSFQEIEKMMQLNISAPEDEIERVSLPSCIYNTLSGLFLINRGNIDLFY